MKQGLSLRVSQHLALTPQLQQSIRLLQLSTLELSQEVEQMLDDNPFLELNAEEAPREEFGLPQVDTPVRRDDLEAESASSSIASNDQATLGSDQNESEVAVPESWEGDGTTEVLPDDSEWGGDAPARKNNLGDDDERADASELARSQESLTTFLHRQALALRLSEVDRAALRFLIESLNDDGYLEDSLASLAAGLAGDDLEQGGCRRRAGSSRTSSSASTPSCASARPSSSGRRASSCTASIAMKPLVLREIADELGLHESTISRVTTAKYMATPFGHLRAEVLLRLGPEHRAGGNASAPRCAR
jgi:DNA-directed RNA polymerase specialized sigma54-like protein